MISSKLVIFVKNEAQKIIYDKELRGQISDGAWENQTTDRRLWYAEVLIASSSDDIGVTSKVQHPIDFNDDFLLEVVGDRMLEYVQEKFPNYTRTDLAYDLTDITNIIFGEG